MEEIRRELTQELDYERELANLEAFRAYLSRWPALVVPAAHRGLCTRRVLVLERLSVREDERYEYRTRKGQVLVFTAAALVKRLLALLAPQRSHLTRFHGVFAPNAKLRKKVMRSPQPEPQPGQQVVAVIGNRRTAEEVLRNLRLLPAAMPVPRTGSRSRCTRSRRCSRPRRSS